tara:strand:- start:2788 stop:3720 length:933 start_codon:yes stop_codon:yes gene_type:complete
LGIAAAIPFFKHHQEEKDMASDIYGFKSELLLGISVDGGEREKSLELRKSSSVTETILANENYRGNHPFQWMGRLISSLIERIGEHEVYEEFRASKFRKVPKAVLAIPMRDVDFVFFLSHMHTHGNTLDMGKHRCSECRKNDLIEADLSTLKVKRSEEDMSSEFGVQLRTGFLREAGSNPQENLPYMGKVWNKYFFRPVTLGDHIRHEEYYSPNNRVNFNMRVIGDALVRVESWGEVDGVWHKLADLEEGSMQMEGMELVDSLDSADRGLIRGAFARLPHLDFMYTHECNHCSSDMKLDVDPTNFHPMVK